MLKAVILQFDNSVEAASISSLLGSEDLGMVCCYQDNYSNSIVLIDNQSKIETTEFLKAFQKAIK